ncbi:MAG TPA: hypothetical protein VFM18_15705, partial [Methanosarcina sp.]|nr:hypothetical protein [Methanosarcina sp.]
ELNSQTYFTICLITFARLLNYLPDNFNACNSPTVHIPEQHFIIGTAVYAQQISNMVPSHYHIALL